MNWESVEILKQISSFLGSIFASLKCSQILAGKGYKEQPLHLGSVLFLAINIQNRTLSFAFKVETEVV